MTQLPSPAKTDQFIDEQTKAREGCGGAVITANEKASSSTTQYRIGSVRAQPPIVIA